MPNEDSRVLGHDGRSKRQDIRERILDILAEEDGDRRLMRLALALDDQGHPKHAEEAYKKVIERRNETSGQKDQVILFCEGKVSSILRQRGLYVKAQDQCRRVLEVSIEATGPTSDLSLQAAGDLALVWRDQGEFDNAFDRIRDVLDNETCSPYQDGLHVRLVAIFALILRDFGHYKMSLYLTSNALRASVALFSDEDPFTLEVASDLSQILTEEGMYHLAEEFARRAHDGFAKTFGTDHPQSLKAASRLANAIRFDDRLEDAKQIYERTLKVQELQLGTLHPDTIPTKCGLAAVYALETRLRDSVSILRPILDQQKAAFGKKNHPDKEWTGQALERIRAFQRALSVDSISDSEVEEESRKMRDFLTKPIRIDQRSLRLHYGLTISSMGKWEFQSRNDSGRSAMAPSVSSDAEKFFSSSLDKTSVSGIWGTTLHLACLVGNLKWVQVHVKSGDDTNVEGGLFGTPFSAALYGGHINVVKFLRIHHAKVKDYWIYGFDIPRLALSMDHDDLARPILEADASHEVAEYWYGNTLYEASMMGQESMANPLLEATAKPNTETRLILGIALGAAAWEGNIIIVKTLLEKGADVNTQVDGRTAFELAASKGHLDIMKLLIREADNVVPALEPKQDREADNIKPALKPKDEPATLEEKSLEPAYPLVEGSKPNTQSEPFKPTLPKLLEPANPLVEDSNPNKQSESPKSTVPKRLEPSKLPDLSDLPSEIPSKDSLSSKAGNPEYEKTQKGKKKDRKTKARVGLAKVFKSATKSLISSSDDKAGRLKGSSLALRDRKSKQKLTE